MTDFQRIAELTEMKFRATHQVFLEICAEEAQLRSDLDKLKSQLLEAEPQVNHEMRLINADATWRIWVGEMRSQLNMQLSRVLARKEEYIARARYDFGKVLVSQDLRDRAQHERQRDKAARALSAAIEMTVQTRAEDQ